MGHAVRPCRWAALLGRYSALQLDREPALTRLCCSLPSGPPFPRPSLALPAPSPRPSHALPTPFPCPFSEIALLTDGVRVASVYAVTDVTCLVLDKASFTRLLGPCEDILKRNMTNYNLYLNQQA